MKKYTKKAFTIIELIVVFVIIGVILMLEMQTINKRINQYGPVYYSVYSSLRKVAYNILADLACPDCIGPYTTENPGTPDERKICTSTGKETFCPDGARQFPDNFEDMCERMADFYNAVGEVNCQNSATRAINDDVTNINDETEIFRTANAVRFYLSDLKHITLDIRDEDGTVTGHENIGYFIVYTDINGSKAPNNIRHDGTDVKPDIVPFAITTRGEVVPIGYPIYDSDYLTAKIQYPFDASEGYDPKDQISESFNFYQAVYGAWGNYTSTSSEPTGTTRDITPKSDISMTINFNDFLPEEVRTISVSDERYPSEEILRKFRDEVWQKSRDKGCNPNNYNCRVTVDSNTTTRF